MCAVLARRAEPVEACPSSCCVPSRPACVQGDMRTRAQYIISTHYYSNRNPDKHDGATAMQTETTDVCSVQRAT
jgi:hypothetical protein